MPTVDSKRLADLDVTWPLVFGGLLAVVALVIVIVSDRPPGAEDRPARNAAISPPPFPGPPPQPAFPSVPPSPRVTSATHRPPTTTVRASRPSASRSPAPSSSPSPQPPVWAAAGTTISLEPADRPGRRVRHHGSQVWVGRPARSDASFRVQPGLAAATCVSLESVDSPGRYLRHQNFVLFAHRRDDTALFAADATFCPVLTGADGHAMLRSVNYPDRYLTIDDSRIHLRVGAGTAFVATKPS